MTASGTVYVSRGTGEHPPPQPLVPAYRSVATAPATVTQLVPAVSLADVRKLVVLVLSLNVVTLVLALGAAVFSGYLFYVADIVR
jgi:hypothetical protein